MVEAVKFEEVAPKKTRFETEVLGKSLEADA
jgi:hypothetical protein